MREGNATQAAYARVKGKRYAETFRCPGGALCLDFCNSGQGARARREEWITGFADLIDWLEAAEAVTKAQAGRLRAAGARSPQAAHALWGRASSSGYAAAEIRPATGYFWTKRRTAAAAGARWRAAATS